MIDISTMAWNIPNLDFDHGEDVHYGLDTESIKRDFRANLFAHRAKAVIDLIRRAQRQ
jgi:hypothetical protein